MVSYLRMKDRICAVGVNIIFDYGQRAMHRC